MDIHVQDANLTNLDLIENYDSLIWTERYSTSGDFELVLPATAKHRSILSKAVHLRIPSSQETMVIESQFDQGTIKLKGRTLDSILERRVVETAGASAFTSFTNYVTRLMTYNIGQMVAIPERKVNNFHVMNILPEGFVDSTSFDGVKYGENLYVAVKTLCDSKGLGFKVINPIGSTNFEFYYTYGQDLTVRKGINFSESIGNIQNVSQLRSDVTYKNVAVVNLPPRDGSSGLGDVYYVNNTSSPIPSGLARREVWSDASDLRKDETFNVDNKPSRAMSWGRIELIGHPPINEVDFELSSTNVYKYEEDYFLGDLVNVINPEGQPIKHRVTEYIQSFGPEGSSAYPTLTAV